MLLITIYQELLASLLSSPSPNFEDLRFFFCLKLSAFIIGNLPLIWKPLIVNLQQNLKDKGIT